MLLDSLDFVGGQIKGAAIETGLDFPLESRIGQLFYLDTDTTVLTGSGLYVNNGTSWIGPHGIPGPAGVTGPAGDAGQAGPQGVSGTVGSTLRSTRCTFTGTVVAQVGVARWYPEQRVLVSKVFFSLGIASPSTVSIDVLKNGASIFNGTYPELVSRGNVSSTVEVEVEVHVTDYLTVNVVGGGGEYLTSSIVYSTF